MSISTQGQPEDIGDAMAVFDAINDHIDTYLSSNTVSCVNGHLTFCITREERSYDEDGAIEDINTWDHILMLSSGQVAMCLAGPVAEPVRRLLQSVEQNLSGETLNIYMADKSNRTARGVVDNVLAELGMEAAS